MTGKHVPVTLQAVSTAPDKGFDGWSDGDFIVISKREDVQKSIDRTRAMLAAQNLLEALKGLLAYVEDGYGDCESLEGEAARAAIAKAEGTE